MGDVQVETYLRRLAEAELRRVGRDRGHAHALATGRIECRSGRQWRLPGPADRYEHNRTPGFSWWLRDRAGNWHVATPVEPWSGTACSPSNCARPGL